MRKRPRIFSVLAAIAAVTPGSTLADVVQAGRYTLVVTTPTEDQSDPLSAIVSVTFPRASISTVGDAVASLLSRSGYGLAQDPYSVPLSFTLPDVQRRFDNVGVRDILQALGSTGYTLRVDPAARSVAYELRPEFVPAAAPAPAALPEPPVTPVDQATSLLHPRDIPTEAQP